MRPETTTESSTETQSPAEVYAASAAEGAIRSSKESGIESGLADISETLQRSSNTNPSSSSLLSQNSEGSDVEPRSNEGSSSQLTKQEELRPAQTKEELIEEALNCPCIASMKEGSCGLPFLAAYRCFLESETEPKGMDCMEQFKSMQVCVADHPEEYNLDDDDPDSDPFANAPPSSDGPSSQTEKIEPESPQESLQDTAVSRDSPSVAESTTTPPPA